MRDDFRLLVLRNGMVLKLKPLCEISSAPGYFAVQAHCFLMLGLTFKRRRCYCNNYRPVFLSLPNEIDCLSLREMILPDRGEHNAEKKQRAGMKALVFRQASVRVQHSMPQSFYIYIYIYIYINQSLESMSCQSSYGFSCIGGNFMPLNNFYKAKEGTRPGQERPLFFVPRAAVL